MQGTNKITSRDNARLVHIRKVRDGKVPDQIFLEGSRLAEEALRSNAALIECVFTASFADSERGHALLDKLAASDIRMSEIPDPVFRSIADTTSSQGIVLTAKRPLNEFDRISGDPGPAGPALFVYLHEVNDPSNLGAVFRSAEAAGASGIVLSPHSANPFSPKALRAAMGSNLRMLVWEGCDIADCVAWAKERGIRVVAADISGAKEHSDLDWTVPSLVIFGSEAHGLSGEALSLADEIFRIPMKNGVESLNLAVSAGIILFEAVRQNSVKR